MKRIIDGKTYNTETATLITQIGDDEGSRAEALYQTRHGAFFRYNEEYLPEAGETGYQLYPCSPTDAQQWLEKHNRVTAIELLFGPQPEAGENESRITLRIPDSLKSRIEELASANKQSLNAWIMRCLETCANVQSQRR